MSSALPELLFARYGLRLDMAQLAEVLNISIHTLRNQISAGKIPIKTYRTRGRRFADFRDVAEYLDACRERSSIA